MLDEQRDVVGRDLADGVRHGRNPRASAQTTSAMPKAVSNRVSGTNVAASVDQRESGMWRWTIASLTMSPPRAGITAFSPEPAR